MGGSTLNSLTDSVNSRLEQLKARKERFVVRAELLPADLALIGLLQDLLDAASGAFQLCQPGTPAAAAAFPLTRTVFEAAQRLIALATSDDYVRVGTRAWLYYQRKDMRFAKLARDPDAAREWFDAATRQFVRVFKAHNPDAEMLMREENERLDTYERNRRADNFMNEDLGALVEARYPKLAAAFHGSVPQLQRTNQAIYAGLSRESHARMRVDPAGLTVTTDGAVRVIPRRVDEHARRKTVLGVLDSSIAEADAALGYLTQRRLQQQQEEIRLRAERLAQVPLPPKFRPDLGLHLMRSGGNETTFHFPDAFAERVGILPDGTVTWSASTTFGDQEFIATFDVPQALVLDLAKALAVEPRLLRAAKELRKHALSEPTLISLECRLGKVQTTNGETFVPLVATRVAPSRVGRDA